MIRLLLVICIAISLGACQKGRTPDVVKSTNDPPVGVEVFKIYSKTLYFETPFISMQQDYSFLPDKVLVMTMSRPPSDEGRFYFLVDEGAFWEHYWTQYCLPKYNSQVKMAVDSNGYFKQYKVADNYKIELRISIDHWNYWAFGDFSIDLIDTNDHIVHMFAEYSCSFHP